MELHRPHYRRVRMSKEAYSTLCKWNVQFEAFCQRDFTFEEVILRALDCLKLRELDVADNYRIEEMKMHHLREIEERHKDEPFYIKDLVGEREYRKLHRKEHDNASRSTITLPDTLLDKLKIAKLAMSFVRGETVFYEDLVDMMIELLRRENPDVEQAMEYFVKRHPEFEDTLKKRCDKE